VVSFPAPRDSAVDPDYVYSRRLQICLTVCPSDHQYTSCSLGVAQSVDVGGSSVDRLATLGGLGARGSAPDGV